MISNYDKIAIRLDDIHHYKSLIYELQKNMKEMER